MTGQWSSNYLHSTKLCTRTTATENVIVIFKIARYLQMAIGAVHEHKIKMAGSESSDRMMPARPSRQYSLES